MKPETKGEVAIVNQEVFDLILNIWENLVKVKELENKEVAHIHTEGEELINLEKMSKLHTSYTILEKLSSTIVDVCVSPSCSFYHADGSVYSLDEQFKKVVSFIKDNSSELLLSNINKMIDPQLTFRREYEEANRLLKLYTKEELAARGFI